MQSALPAAAEEEKVSTPHKMQPVYAGPTNGKRCDFCFATECASDHHSAEERDYRPGCYDWLKGSLLRANPGSMCVCQMAASVMCKVLLCALLLKTRPYVWDYVHALTQLTLQPGICVLEGAHDKGNSNDCKLLSRAHIAAGPFVILIVTAAWIAVQSRKIPISGSIFEAKRWKILKTQKSNISVGIIGFGAFGQTDCQTHRQGCGVDGI